MSTLTSTRRKKKGEGLPVGEPNSIHPRDRWDTEYYANKDHQCIGDPFHWLSSTEYEYDSRGHLGIVLGFLGAIVST